MRNANRGLRSEPPNPQTQVSPGFKQQSAQIYTENLSNKLITNI